MLVCFAAMLPGHQTLPTDLSTETIDAEIAALQEDSWALIEFFASWCGVCQHFKPAYEAAADMIAASGERSHVFVARVDCATEIQACSQFDIGRYPTVLLGHPRDFNRNLTGSKRAMYSGPKDTGQLVDWVAKEIGRPIVPTGAALHPDAARPLGPVSKEAAAVAVKLAVARQVVDLVDVVTVTIRAYRETVNSPVRMKGLAARETLKDFLDLLTAAHPVKQCRIGAGKAGVALAKAWPGTEEAPVRSAALSHIHICGSKLGEQPWGACHGSSPGSRGYPCAMWQLFHSLAANLPEKGAPGVLWMTAVKGFMAHFFPCEDCSHHFVTMASETDAMVVETADEALLWSWRSHNRVNARVNKQEGEEHFGDASFPKVQWPQAALCPKCRIAGPGGDDGGIDGGWSEADVLKFLKAFYTGGLGGGAGSKRKWFLKGNRKTSINRDEPLISWALLGHSRIVRTIFWAVFMILAILAFFALSSVSRSRTTVKQLRGNRNSKVTSRPF